MSPPTEVPAPPAPAPRVKITAWRLLNSAVLLVLGTSKAVSIVLGQTTVPDNLDWTVGVVWALISYWVSLVEQEASTVAPWLFITDRSISVRVGAAGVGVVSAVAIYWAAIYGVIVLGFGRSIQPPLLHGVAAGFTGLAGLVLLVLVTVVYYRAAPHLRNIFAQVRLPRVTGLFRRSDWGLTLEDLFLLLVV